jgi:hypothetical protein
MSKKAMELALEALNSYAKVVPFLTVGVEQDAIFALKEALTAQSDPFGYARFTVDDAGKQHFHSFTETTDGWNVSLCYPLYIQEKEQQSVVVAALYKTERSSEARVFKTEEQALQWRTEIAMANWDEEFPHYPLHEGEEIGYVYFDAMSGMTEQPESFQTYFTTLEGD